MIQKEEIIEIKQALQKICSHQLFANSSIYSRLLTYLVEKAIAEEDLKELTIGADLFEKAYSVDKKEGNVRSYMYQLRKKLSAYYEESGGHESIIFEINKGQYNLSFVSPKKYYRQHEAEGTYIKVPLKYLKFTGFTLIGLSIIALIAVKYLHQPGWVWKPFFANKSGNIVVMSDQFVLDQHDENGESHAILYREINNQNDFIEYTRTHPQKKIYTTDYTLMSKMAPYSIKPITEWFLSNNSDYTLKLESSLTYDDVRNHNILFIGQFKTMNLSKSLFLKGSKMFSTYKDGFKFKNDTSEKVYNTIFEQNGNIEYAMVSYNSYSPGKKALFFVSNNDIGVIATVRNFTNPKWLSSFGHQLPKSTQYFNALFEVSGIQRNDTNCKLVALEIVAP